MSSCDSPAFALAVVGFASKLECSEMEDPSEDGAHCERDHGEPAGHVDRNLADVREGRLRRRGGPGSDGGATGAGALGGSAGMGRGSATVSWARASPSTNGTVDTAPSTQRSALDARARKRDGAAP